MFTTYYESWAFILVHADNDLFERITNQLEKLSPLPFRLKYTHLLNSTTTTKTTAPTVAATPSTSTTTNQRPSSLLPKRFTVRGWLRDRKTQVKISPKEPTASTNTTTVPLVPPPPPPPTSSSLTSTGIPKSSSSNAIQSQKSASSIPTKTISTIPSVPPPAPNISLRRKLGSIPVPKRHQTVH